MEKDLLGNDIKKKIKKAQEKGSISKNVYFSKLFITEHIKYNALGNPVVNTLSNLLNKTFVENDNNFTYNKRDYNIKVHSKKENEYIFGSISLKKQFIDLMAVPYDNVHNQTLDPKAQSIIMYAFFYIDINDKIISYLPGLNIKRINEIISKYIEFKIKQNIIIKNFALPDIRKKIQQCNEAKLLKIFLTSSEAQKLYAGLRHTLKWDDGAIENVDVEIKIKKPNKKRVLKFLQNPNKSNIIKKAVLKTEDEYYTENIIDIFNSILSIKTDINISELDLNNFDLIKNKLIASYNKIKY